MRSKAHGRTVRKLSRTAVLSIILILCSSSSFSTNRRPSRILCRETLTEAKREELASKLRAITGWDDLTFDPDGALQPGSKTPSSGSGTARDLIGQAVSGNQVVILEDASNRSDVVFSRVVPARWTTDSRDNPPAFVVLIDFADFDRVIGDKAALKAFDVGWGFLHELDHVVNDSVDADSLENAGECEAHINQMRRECGLPLRAEYFFKALLHAEESEFKTRFVRLAFEREDATAGKHRRYWVMWDAAVVGGLSTTNLIATLNR